MKISAATATVVVAVAIAASAHGQTLQMTWVDRSGKAVGVVGPGGPYRGPDLAPNGKQFAVHRHDEGAPGRPGGGDVWIFESGAQTGRRLTGDGSSMIENAMPIWSPDGTRVVYGSVRNGKGGLYVKRADGTGTEELLIESETSKMPMSWSPDGRYIVYWVPGNIQWILPLTGDRKPFQLSEAPTSHAQISPDGKWIAFMSTATFRSEITVKPFPRGSGQVQVSKEGAVFPRWRGDGKELFFLSAGSQGKMMAADITVTGSTLRAGAPHELFDSAYINLGHIGGNYHVFAVSADGQRFLIPRPDASLDDPNARTLTLLDRGGKTVGTIEQRGFYNLINLSHDRTRVALLRNDPVKGTTDVWAFDLATGKGTAITASKREEPPRTPVWSADGKMIAYVVSRNGTEAIYRKPSNGEGAEELVYTLTGANISLQEFTADGRYLTYYSPQLGGNIEFALPLTGEMKPIQVARSEYFMFAARLSPNSRFVAFRTNESGRDEIWVRRVDESGNPNVEKWQVSKDGGTGPVGWKSDGTELYYLSLDRGIMAVDVRTESSFEAGTPRLLFKVPEAFPAGAGLGPVTSMGRDGERFLFAVPPTPRPPAPLPQITILDRQGKSVRTVGEPGRYSDAALSRDGTRVLVRKNPETVGNAEIWVFDIASGKGTLVASGQLGPMLWSPDSKQVFYVVNRPGGFNVIMRKAADASGADEMVFRYTPGAPVNISDITPDEKFLIFESGGVMLSVPLTAGDPATRQAIEFLREEYFAFGGRVSPDGRWLAYMSTETDRSELYVRPFDSSTGKPIGGNKWRVTNDGVSDTVSWRADGRELYYRKNDMSDGLTMSVEVSAPPRFQAGTPKFLFRAANAGSAKNVSSDGQRFVVTMTPAP